MIDSIKICTKNKKLFWRNLYITPARNIKKLLCLLMLSLPTLHVNTAPITEALSRINDHNQSYSWVFPVLLGVTGIYAGNYLIGKYNDYLITKILASKQKELETQNAALEKAKENINYDGFKQNLSNHNKDSQQSLSNVPNLELFYKTLRVEYFLPSSSWYNTTTANIVEMMNKVTIKETAPQNLNEIKCIDNIKIGQRWFFKNVRNLAALWGCWNKSVKISKNHFQATTLMETNKKIEFNNKRMPIIHKFLKDHNVYQKEHAFIHSRLDRHNRSLDLRRKIEQDEACKPCWENFAQLDMVNALTQEYKINSNLNETQQLVVKNLNQEINKFQEYTMNTNILPGTHLRQITKVVEAYLTQIQNNIKNPIPLKSKTNITQDLSVEALLIHCNPKNPVKLVFDNKDLIAAIYASEQPKT